MELHFIILIALSALVLFLIILIICTYCCCVDVCFWGDFGELGTRGFDTRTSTTKSKYSSKGSYGGDYYANSAQTLPSTASLVYQTREDHQTTPLLTKEPYRPLESEKQRKTSYPSKDGFYFPLPPRNARVEYPISTLINSGPRPAADRPPTNIPNQSSDQKDRKNVEAVEYQHRPVKTPQGDAYLVERYPQGHIYYGGSFPDDVERVDREETTYRLPRTASRGASSGNVATVERKETMYHQPYSQPGDVSSRGLPPSNVATVERREAIYHRPYTQREDVSSRGSSSSNVATTERKETIYYPYSQSDDVLPRGPPPSNVATVERKETIYHHPHILREDVSPRGPSPSNVATVERKEVIYHHPYTQPKDEILTGEPPPSNVVTVERKETIYHTPYSYSGNVAPPPSNIVIVQRKERTYPYPENVSQRGSPARHEITEHQVIYPNQKITYEKNPSQTVYYHEPPPRYESIQDPYYHEETHQTTLPQERRTTKTIQKVYTVESSQAPSKIGSGSSETVHYSERPVNHQTERFRYDTTIANPSGAVQNGSWQNGYSKHIAYPIEGKEASSSFSRHGSQSSLYDNN